MADSARTEEIRARELDTVSSQERRDDYDKAKRWMEIGFAEMKHAMIDALGQRDDALRELAALQEEVERLKGALRAATRCPTCEGTGKMTLECMACLSGEPGARCTCAEETCAQCDGRGWATADGTGEELVAAALSPSPAQEQP